MFTREQWYMVVVLSAVIDGFRDGDFMGPAKIKIILTVPRRNVDKPGALLGCYEVARIERNVELIPLSTKGMPADGSG